MTTAGARRIRTWAAVMSAALAVAASAFTAFRSLQTATDAWLFVAPAVMSAVLGSLVALRRNGHPIGLLLVGVGVSASLLGVVDVVSPTLGDRASRGIAGALADAFFVITFVQVFVLLPLSFPTGRALSLFWKWVGRVAVALAAFTSVTALISHRLCVAYPPGGGACLEYTENPIGVALVSTELADMAFLPLMLMGLFGLAGLAARYRRSRGIERQQMKWLVLAVVFLVAVFVLSVEPIRIATGLNATALMSVLLTLGYSSIPIACALAVGRYRLYEIDRIISRTITYALVVGTLGIFFAIAVTAVTSVLPTQDSLAVAGATLLVAAVFNPLRRRIQIRVDMRFNRSRYDAERLMKNFTDRLHASVGDTPVLDELLTVVIHALQPTGAAVWVKDLGR